MTQPVPNMTALAQTALDFCRECLGWARPVDRKFAEQNLNCTGDGGSKAWTPYIFDYYGKLGQFHYTDLNAVMGAVRGWVSSYGEEGDGTSVVCVELRVMAVGNYAVVSHMEHSTLARTEGTADPCHALMAACVEAARKLKAAA